MKFLIVSLALVAFATAQQQYQQQQQQPQPYQPPIAILRQTQDSAPDGSYSYSYETENGIQVAEQGTPVGVGPDGETELAVQGSFQYPGPDGTPLSVTYIANEDGFQPQGQHLPGVPVLIQRALDYIAAHPEENGNKE